MKGRESTACPAKDVFVRAFVDRFKRKDVSLVGPYLFRMAANACTDHLRKRRRQKASSLDDAQIQMIPSGRPTPSEEVRAREELDRAEDLLRRLPKAQAEAIRLRVFDGLSLNEIAGIVGISMDTVSSRLRYGFKKLRKIVSRTGRAKP